MAIDFDFTPFLFKFSCAVDQEGAALDAAHLFSVHVFHFDDIEQLAEFFVSVRKQIKAEPLFGFEVFMAAHGVA